MAAVINTGPGTLQVLDKFYSTHNQEDKFLDLRIAFNALKGKFFRKAYFIE